MDAWVYHSAKRNDEAAALTEQLRASGEFVFVRPANSRYYDGEIHKGDVVYHDGSRRDIVWANEREGVECRQFAGSEVSNETKVPGAPDIDEALAVPMEAAEEVRQNGPWYTAYRDGVKIGTSKRSEAEAWAIFGEAS